MNLTDAITKATANGWSDDSRWTRSNVTCQMSTERDGLLASITVFVTGRVRWNVCSPDGAIRSQRGTVPTVEAALNACDDTIAAVTGTLF